MKRILTVLLGVGLAMMAWVSPVWAADTAHGAQVFASNCAACHIGGGNVVNGAKTLKIDDLNQYEMASIEAIKTQVTNGKNAMPAFQGRLTAEDIDDVASYVLEQAEKGW
jgi:cytochrome c6